MINKFKKGIKALKNALLKLAYSERFANYQRAAAIGSGLGVLVTFYFLSKAGFFFLPETINKYFVCIMIPVRLFFPLLYFCIGILQKEGSKDYKAFKRAFQNALGKMYFDGSLLEPDELPVEN